MLLRPTLKICLFAVYRPRNFTWGGSVGRIFFLLPVQDKDIILMLNCSKTDQNVFLVWAKMLGRSVNSKSELFTGDTAERQSFIRNLNIFKVVLTYLCLASHKRGLGKQYRPRSDPTERSS